MIFFFDLDGTLRRRKSGETFINDLYDQEPIPGAQKAVEYYKSKGFLCIGITNEESVAANQKSLIDAEKEQKITLEIFPKLLCIYFCPDFQGNHCWLVPRNFEAKPIHNDWAAQFAGEFQKPGAGMIKAAILNHHGYGLPDDCWLVGDRPEDFECAKNAGIKFIWASIMLDKFVPGIYQRDIANIDRETLLNFLSI